MNLIEEDLKQKETKQTNKFTKIIIISMVILAILIVAVIGAIMYIKSNTLKLSINGVDNTKVRDMMRIEEDGTIYFPIKDIAPFLGYSSYNGEYEEKSEDANKCYIQCDDEIVNFSLNSKKIYRLTTSDNNAVYEYNFLDKPIKAVNGKLYATTDGIEQAFNVAFFYNENTKSAQFYTMPYLIESYSKKVLDLGYAKISEDFTNHKAVLNDMLVVSKDGKSNFGVINVKGQEILEAKYDDIKYLPYSGDFLVKGNGKVGIISKNKQTKVQLIYDNLQLIDSDLGLYLANRNNKYGVIDEKGNVKIYIEYDEIGIDNTKFAQNGIKNKYLLVDNLIPVKKGELWGLFDKNGNKVAEPEYDGFGYVATSNKDAINLLVIPNYNVIVARKDKKYTLIDATGEVLFLPVFDDVYMTISAGEKHYYINYNDNLHIDAEDLLDQRKGFTSKQNDEENTQVNNNKTSENLSSTNSISEENTVDETKNEEEQTNESEE